MKKNWATPTIVKLEVSGTAGGTHPNRTENYYKTPVGNDPS